MAGLLDSVLGTGKAINSAATQTVAPEIAAFDVEAKKTEDAKLEQQRLMNEMANEKAAVFAEPLPEKPAVPTLEALPEKPEAQDDNPLQTFGRMMPILAALAGSKSADSAVAALNAGTAAMNAMEANDKEALDLAHRDWLANMDRTLKTNGQMVQEYNLAFNDRKASWDEKLAKMSAIAANYGDRIGAAALTAGNPGAVIERNKVISGAADNLTKLYQGAQDDQRQREELALRRQQVEASIENDRAQLASQKWTVNGAAGQVARKILQGEPLNDGDVIVWSAWKESNRGGGMAGGPLGAAVGGAAGGAAADPAADIRGLVPGGAAAPAALAPAAAGASAPKSSTPPVSLLKEGVATTMNDGSVWTLRGGKAVKVG